MELAHRRLFWIPDFYEVLGNIVKKDIEMCCFCPMTALVDMKISFSKINIFII